MSKSERITRKSLALLTTILLHAILVVVLLLLYIPKAEPKEEEMGGILVNIGDMIAVQGTFDPHEYLPREETSEPQRIEEAQEDPLLTQETPEAPAIPPREKKKPKETPDPRRKERLLQEEAKRKATEEARKREEAIKKNVSGAFGNAQNTRGSGESSEGSTTGKEGSPDGNVERGGVNVGVGGFGSFSLAGRKLIGALPRPAFTAQVEGTIVVRITVDPSGKVISTNLAPGTTISDYKMRQSAMSAARNARFTETDGINNQVGTITYHYRLR